MVEAVLQDYRTAPIEAREKALFAFVEKMNRNSSVLRKEDLDEAKAAGWSDEALYDAITVCALFNFYNTWIDATVRYLVEPREAGRVKTRLIQKMLQRLNAEPDRVGFPKDNLR